MKTDYPPRREGIFGLFIFFVPAALWAVALLDWNPLIAFINVIATLFFAWIWFDTGYLIYDECLFYRSGPIRGKIPIASIHEIKKNVRSWYGTRPALAFSYIQIRYDKGRDLFIAPKNEEQFIGDLKSLRPEIRIQQ